MTSRRLHPEAHRYLRKLEAVGSVDYETLTVDEARKTHESSLAFAGEPEPVAQVEDRAIPGPHGEIPIRIYRPQGSAPFPGLVYFHGGGWVVGHLGTVDVSLRAVSNRAGCVIVSVDYRLAPEHKFPVPLDDCWAATRWVAATAAEIGVVPGHIAVGGDSAGGNLAAATALLASHEGGPSLVLQLLIYPVTNFDFDTRSYWENAQGYALTTDAMRWYWNHYLPEGDDGSSPLVSPLRAADLSGLPPAFVATCEFDPLRDEGEEYARRLRDAGVPVTIRRYDGMIHGFFRLGGVINAAERLVDDCAAALGDAFSPRPARPAITAE
jgi:acetyl esterase